MVTHKFNKTFFSYLIGIFVSLFVQDPYGSQ